MLHAPCPIVQGAEPWLLEAVLDESLLQLIAEGSCLACATWARHEQLTTFLQAGGGLPEQQALINPAVEVLHSAVDSTSAPPAW